LKNLEAELIVDGRLILKWNLKKWSCKGVDWIHLTHDTVQWRDLVNTVMNAKVPQRAENCLTGEILAVL